MFIVRCAECSMRKTCRAFGLALRDRYCYH